MIWLWKYLYRLRRSREVLLSAARWLLEENARLRAERDRERTYYHDAVREASRRPHPDDLTAVQLLADGWEKAARLAGEELEAARRDLKEATSRFDAELTVARARIRDLEREIDLADSQPRVLAPAPLYVPGDIAKPGEW